MSLLDMIGSSSCFAEDGYLALSSDNSHLHTRFLRIIGCYVVSTQCPKMRFYTKTYVPWVPCVVHVHLSPSFNYTDTIR